MRAEGMTMGEEGPARGSAASRVFATVVITVVAVAGLTVGALRWEAQRAARSEAERVTAAIAYTLSVSPTVIDSLAEDDRSRATAALQPVAVGVVEGTPADFVTVMDEAGTRITHRDPAQIGLPYIGTIPATDAPLTEEFAGTLGPSVRTIAPIRTSAGITDGDPTVGALLLGKASQAQERGIRWTAEP